MFIPGLCATPVQIQQWGDDRNCKWTRTGGLQWQSQTVNQWVTEIFNDHLYRMVKESNSNIWPNQTIVSDQSELTLLSCQPMIRILTAAAWYSCLQLLPSYIWSLEIFDSFWHSVLTCLSQWKVFNF